MPSWMPGSSKAHVPEAPYGNDAGQYGNELPQTEPLTLSRQRSPLNPSRSISDLRAHRRSRSQSQSGAQSPPPASPLPPVPELPPAQRAGAQTGGRPSNAAPLPYMTAQPPVPPLPTPYAAPINSPTRSQAAAQNSGFDFACRGETNLAGIGTGAVTPPTERPSTAQSAASSPMARSGRPGFARQISSQSVASVQTMERSGAQSPGSAGSNSARVSASMPVGAPSMTITDMRAHTEPVPGPSTEFAIELRFKVRVNDSRLGQGGRGR